MLARMRMRIGRSEVQLSTRISVGRVLEILREQRAAAGAIRRMPKPVTWEWARPRLVPLLAGPMIDPEGESLVRVAMDPGIAVVFAIDLGAAFPLIDEEVATRWECTAEQIRDVATANLRRWAAALEPRVVVTATMSGHQLRLIKDRPGWASSILLVPDELRRLFGDDDQVFAAPCRGTLLSFAPGIPPRLAREVVVDFESGSTYPLMLDPFALQDGVLSWGGNDDWDDSDLWQFGAA